MKFAGHGTSTVRLLCGGAQCMANIGATVAAQRLLDRAADARDTASEDTVCGLFAFSYAKQLYYAGSSLMWLDDRTALQRADRDASAAIALWEQEAADCRSLDDEALARCTSNSSPEAWRDRRGHGCSASYACLPQERQISWIRRRIGELADLLTPDRFDSSRLRQKQGTSCSLPVKRVLLRLRSRTATRPGRRAASALAARWSASARMPQ